MIRKSFCGVIDGVNPNAVSIPIGADQAYFKIWLRRFSNGGSGLR
jgi:hypothetical protein